MNDTLFLGLTSTAWTGMYTLLTAGLLLAAILAGIYAGKQVKISRAQNRDAKLAQLEASRPYIIVAIEPSRASQHLFDLVVRNIGKRPAFNVSVNLEPPPVRANETVGHEIANIKILTTPIAMIAPGQQLRAFYDSHIERSERDDLPISHQAQLRYFDSAHRSYEEDSVIDIEAMQGALFTKVYTIHDLGKSLEKIQKMLDKSSALGKRGHLNVETAIETRSRRLRRERREYFKSLLGHADLLRVTLPNRPTEWQRIHRRVPRTIRARYRAAKGFRAVQSRLTQSLRAAWKKLMKARRRKR